MADQTREYGMASGKVFPAAQAKSLLNPARRLVQSPRRTVAAARLSRTSRTLELGCGPGYFSPSVAEATDELYVLFDLQPEMLQIARTRVPPDPRIGSVAGDGAKLPFAAATFDAVFVATVLGEIPDRRGCLAEVRRVLRPAGVFAVAETRRDSDFIPLSALSAAVEAAGFGRESVRGWRWQYVAVFRPN